jgi:hypothetical protein
MRYEFRLDTDHFQFYLEDRAIAHNTSLLWSAPVVDGRLDVLDGLLAIGTVRWGHDTPVTIEREHQLPIADDVDGWDVVAEASIRTISGKLRLTTPEGDDAQAPAISIPPGSYRVRVCYGQLHSVVDELAPHGADIYRLLIWPSEPSSPRMLKGETSTTSS